MGGYDFAARVDGPLPFASNDRATTIQ
jgi:hypothetical protein